MEGLIASCFFKIILGVVIGYLSYKLLDRINRLVPLTFMAIFLAAGIIFGSVTRHSKLTFDNVLSSVCCFVGPTLGYWFGARKKSRTRKHEP